MPYEFEHDHLIHPATLDAIFHLIIVAVSGGKPLREAAVPLRMERMFISTDLPTGVGSLFSGFAKKTSESGRRMTADMIVSDPSWSGPKIVVEGLVVSQVTGGASGPLSSTIPAPDSSSKRCTQIVWNLDPTLLPSGLTSLKSLPVRTAIDGSLSSLQRWMEVECHKSTKLDVLLLGNSMAPPPILGELSPFLNGETPYHGIRSLAITDSTDSALATWRDCTNTTKSRLQYGIFDPASDMKFPIADAKYSVVILSEHALSGLSSERLRSITHSGGRLVILSQSDCTAVGINTLPRVVSPLEERDVYLLMPDDSNRPTADLFARHLQTALGRRQVTAHTISLADMAETNNKSVISLLDLGSGFAAHWTQEQMHNFQTLVSRTRNVFWISSGAQMLVPSAKGLEDAPTTGLLRVLRNEYPQLSLCHLDLSPTFDINHDSSSELLSDAWLRSVASASEDEDLEFAELDGRLFIPRFITEPSFDDELVFSTGNRPPVAVEFTSAGPLRLDIVGSTDASRKLTWFPESAVSSPIADEEVEIQVKAISGPLSTHHVVKEMVQAPDSNVFIGTQVVGTVTQRGRGVFALDEGDEVIMMGTRGCRTHMRQNHSLVQRLPKGFQANAAASTTWLAVLASYILRRVVRMTGGETMLVTSASSPLHWAVAQHARRLGGRVILSASTKAEFELLSKAGEPSDEIVLLSLSGLKSYILGKTGGKGIDILVTNQPDLAASRKLLFCVAEFGRAVAITKHDAMDTLSPSFKNPNITFTTIDAENLLTEKTAIAAQLLKDYDMRHMQVLEVPGVHATFTASEIDKCLALLAQQSKSGVFTIDFTKDGNVPMSPPPLQRQKLDRDGIYVLAGGLGSLGMRIANLMAADGAGHIVFLSRSGGGDGRYKAELDDLRSTGALVSVKQCNIVDSTQVRDVMNELAETGSPIKGVVQCAMVLQVRKPQFRDIKSKNGDWKLSSLPR